MEYKPTNDGLLAASMVKAGDKLIIISDAYSTFNEPRQKTYWNCKVQLPDGTHKLAGLFDSACDAFAAKWGTETGKWTGHTVLVEIRTAKASGNPYIWLTPTDDEIVDVVALNAEQESDGESDIQIASEGDGVEAKPKDAGKKVEYPKDKINPDDIPF